MYHLPAAPRKSPALPAHCLARQARSQEGRERMCYTHQHRTVYLFFAWKGSRPLHIDEMRSLYDYTYWATDRLFETVANLSEEQLNDEMPNGIGSIRVTLVHLVSGHWIWRERWQGNSSATRLNPDDFPTLETIRERWQEEKHRISELLATLSDEDLERQVTYSNTGGRVLQLSLWRAMLHLVNHGTQHRSEIAMRLTELGHSPGELGMSVFFLTHY
jgi:uncharacterized damage-inducible protein DinB